MRIFRFRNLNSLEVDAIKNTYLWFSSFDSLNDPFEGIMHFDKSSISSDTRIKYYRKCLSRQKGLSEEQANEIIQRIYISHQNTVDIKSLEDHIDQLLEAEFWRFYAKEHRSNNFVCCVSMQKEEKKFPAPLNNMMMWAHYANGFRGICIEFDSQELISSLNVNNGNSKIVSEPVLYPEHDELPSYDLESFCKSALLDNTDTSINILRAMCTKEKSWAYENELRLISPVQGKNFYNKDSIRSLYVPLRHKLDDENKKQWTILKEFCEKNSIPIYGVKIHSTHYKLGYKRIG
ncbi:DUF2971 domain-containing protein [Vibrio natriegens]|uniref:DUF2971 domain-containing protein n=1 Tax=Vibrio natriegens TaxID=691 RepID=UPI000803FB28|nr:DUF2971 domain-containing protein [Vibrio natriegens]ANQ19416.1 hypothetical protein BA891_19795 [Vibrio natriegens]